MDILKIAEQAISKGYNVLVADTDKQPIGKWQDAQSVPTTFAKLKSSVEYSMSLNPTKVPSYLGLICGKTNGNLEVIDVDTKNAVEGDDLWKTYVELVTATDSTILPKCSIQSTVNGGYHIMYRADKPYATQKLANRILTLQEFDAEKEKELAKLKDDLEVEKINQQRYDQQIRNVDTKIWARRETLIETRGQGGYVVIQPSEGYQFIQGSLASMPTLDKQDRDVLINCARQLNQEPVKKLAEIKYNDTSLKSGGVTPFDDYNARATPETVLNVLQDYGWSLVSQTSKKIHVLRDGNSKAKTSGNFDVELGLFSVFSTSTIFQTDKGYSPAAVYSILVHNGDFSAAAKDLYAKGYGDRINSSKPKQLDEILPLSAIVPDGNTDVSKYIYSWDKIDQELDDWFSGRVKLGESTGIEKLDHWFKFKRNALYLCTGKLGRGKTTIQQFMFVMASMVNNWKWLIVCMENSKMDFVENLITFVLKENAADVKRCNRKKYDIAHDFVKAHFNFLTTDVDNIDMLLSVAKEYQKVFPFDAMFIDPINSIQPKKGSDWDFTTGVGAASKILRFREEVASVFVSQHPIMSKQRESGSPSSADGEGGYFANKADFAFVLDRPSGSNETTMKIDKVRNRKSGGNETDQDNPIVIIYKFHTIHFSVPYYVDGMYRYDYIKDTLPELDYGQEIKTTQTELELNETLTNKVLPTPNEAFTFAELGEDEAF